MRTAGSKSWRVSVDHQDQVLHVALCIRDHYQLNIVQDDVPPRLNWKVPIGKIPVDLQHSEELPDQWLWWWRQLVRASSLRQLGSDLSGSDEFRDLKDSNETAQYFDPFEDFQSLNSQPQLKHLATESWRRAIEWSKPLYQNSRVPTRAAVKEVAESVLAERQVLPERINAGVIILAVNGVWSTIFHPGVLLCSTSTYANDSLFAVELKKTIESSLRDRDH